MSIPANNLEVRINDWVTWLSGQTFSGPHVKGEIAASLQQFVEKEFEMARNGASVGKCPTCGHQKVGYIDMEKFLPDE